MLPLRDLVYEQLRNKDNATIDVDRLYKAIPEGTTYTRLAGGLFVPDVGVIGDWSSEEKNVVKNIIDAREQGHSLGHAFGKALSGVDDPYVATHKNAYQRLEQMKPGDIARVKVENKEYVMVALPAEMPATALVLFVK
ncbi:MAG: hypothetical protein GXO64_05065 [Candidatus Micrarchaeota archaeon]|nr:hypothetical protein [Candidatus Micrarchaeota archaeon]